jgi:CBS domain-containing protein
MSRPAVMIHPLATVTEAAHRMHRAGVRRLPVVDVVGRLVGIVRRVDLLTWFLRSDEELRREIFKDVIFGSLPMAPSRFAVDVPDGVVVLQAPASGAASSRRWCARSRPWTAWSGS